MERRKVRNGEKNRLILSSTLDRKKTWNRLTCEQALRGSLAAGRQRRDCSQARTSEMLNEFAIECL